jgi:hypothetical protein
LKKDRYLNPGPAANAAPTTAAAKPAAPPPALAAPPRQPAAGNSLMAEKMLQAGLLRPKAN